MKKRELGKTGIEVAPLALGGNVFGWTADESASFKLLDAFMDEGFSLIDTADMYSQWVPGHKGGESETIIGKWLKKSGKRSQAIMATKVGLPMGEEKKGLSASYIQQAVEDSLRRLQTDHIDLYQAHKTIPTRRSPRRWKPSLRWSGKAKCASSEPPTIAASAWPKPSS